MSRRPVALTLSMACLIAAAAAPAADAMVQIDRGIAGARIGNTRAAVRAALGQPASTRSGNNEFGSFVEFRFSGGIRVFFQGGNKVSSVSTTGLGDRTGRGVGVRSSEQTVMNKVPGVTCETVAGTRSCHTGTFSAGRRVTDFLIRNGRVTRVTVGIVID
jgi:hypothetical protein